LTSSRFTLTHCWILFQTYKSATQQKLN